MIKHIFGPVPSRRLGRSLGVDLVPFKTCTYDCIYCQLGRTTCKTIKRQEWVPLDEVLAELRQNRSAKPDYITLSGSGEPTLYSRLDELIAGIHAMTGIPVAVLTNGSLLWKKEVRSQLMEADLIVPSLDAGDDILFKSVNRPHASISFNSMFDGLKSLSDEFHGMIWLEVLLTGGYTAVKAEVEKIARLVCRIRPDRIQLNTVTRPPAEEFAIKVSRERLEEFARLFVPHAEVIADFHDTGSIPAFSVPPESVINLLQRRPCSIDDITKGLGIHKQEAIKQTEHLMAERSIELFDLNGKSFFRLTRGIHKAGER